MNVNENLLLVIIENNALQENDGEIKTQDQQSKTEVVIAQLLHLWKKQKYTIVSLGAEKRTQKTTTSSHKLIKKVQQWEQMEVLLNEALQHNPFSRIVVVGKAKGFILDFIAQYAQLHHLMLYRVTDAVEATPSDAAPYFWFKDITSHQIKTLFKSIKDT